MKKMVYRDRNDYFTCARESQAYDDACLSAAARRIPRSQERGNRKKDMKEAIVGGSQTLKQMTYVNKHCCSGKRRTHTDIKQRVRRRHNKKDVTCKNVAHICPCLCDEANLSTISLHLSLYIFYSKVPLSISMFADTRTNLDTC